MIQNKFGVRSLRDSPNEMMAALYLQVSIVSQALIFVTRSRSWSFTERPGALLMGAFMIAQLVSIVFISSFTYTYKHHKITYRTPAWLWATNSRTQTHASVCVLSLAGFYVPNFLSQSRLMFSCSSLFSIL